MAAICLACEMPGRGKGAPSLRPPLHCKLPIYTLGEQGSGAFITFPSGAITPDSSSANLHVDGGGVDWFGLTFDTAVNRWLPVPSTSVTPEGTLYAYAL